MRLPDHSANNIAFLAAEFSMDQHPFPSTTASHEDARQRRVAARAYALFEARGGEHGHDLEDWMAAERDERREEEEADNERLLRSIPTPGVPPSTGNAARDARIRERVEREARAINRDAQRQLRTR